MWKNHSEPVEWIEKTLNKPFRGKSGVWPDFIELCERRNLFTHAGGKVSDKYLKICKDNGHDIKEAVLGDALVIDPKYYKKSVEIILELGNKLVHFVWINLFPKDVEPAYVRLDQIAYRLIENERHKLASTILQFGLNEIKKIRKSGQGMGQILLKGKW